MAINFSKAVRSDLPFLTRRTKPRQSAPAASAAPAGQAAPTPSPAPRGETQFSFVPTLGLSPTAQPSAARASNTGHGRPAAGSGAAATRGLPAAGLFPAPGINDGRTLNEKSPLVRLAPLQSAVGSLLVTGTRAVVWEAADLTTGARTAESAPAEVLGTEVQTAGNRPLVGYAGDVAVIPLRHAGELRRALFIPRPDTPMLVEIYDGGTVVLPFDTADPANMSAGPAAPNCDQQLVQVLSVLRVGNQLELRAEALPAGSLDLPAVLEEFGFTLTESMASTLRRN